MIDVDYLAGVRPAHRQLRWQKLEFYGFVHVGVNTMTDREWGDGTESPAIFDPADLDADAWVRLMRDAGMRGVILTAKHHDGFCLWPTGTTGHSVAASPWRGGRGDLVREVAEACARHGMRFGVYLSPWDRNHPAYGSGTGYDDVYVAQLVELLTGYGEVFTVWLDGANGEGPNGKRQIYDWDRYYRTIRALQPEAVISVCGPDVRWCGNEAGHTRAEEWSVVPRGLQDAERIADRSQQADDGEFSRQVRSDEEDLGSRAALEAAGVGIGDLVWYPAEVNTSIRPGWFHHPGEDSQVRSAAELFEIYQRAVGGNSTFLLNVPPTRQGRIAEPDRAALLGLGRLIEELRAAARTPVSGIEASSGGDGTGLDSAGRVDLTDLDSDTGHWSPASGDEAPWLEITLAEPAVVDGVVLKERIGLGQRIEHVRVLGWDGQGWTQLAEARSIGYQRIWRFAPVRLERLRVEVLASRGRPAVGALAVLRASTDDASTDDAGAGGRTGSAADGTARDRR